MNEEEKRDFLHRSFWIIIIWRAAWPGLAFTGLMAKICEEDAEESVTSAKAEGGWL